MAIVKLIDPKHSAKLYDLITSGFVEASDIRFNKRLTLCVECNRVYYQSDPRQMFCSRICSGKASQRDLSVDSEMQGLADPHALG